jgi:hypothetical protein
MWVEMGDLISDEMVESFGIVCEPEDVPKQVLARYGDVVDRFSFYTPYSISGDELARIMTGFKG